MGACYAVVLHVPSLEALASASAPDYPPGVSHLPARRRGAPGDEGRNRLLHAAGVVGRILLGRSADLAADHHRLGALIRVEDLQRVARRRADDRIATDAVEDGLALARLGQNQRDQGAEAARSEEHTSEL